MFKHSTGWDLNARILALQTRLQDGPGNTGENKRYLDKIVREEIAADRDLVWC